MRIAPCCAMLETAFQFELGIGPGSPVAPTGIPALWMIPESPNNSCSLWRTGNNG